MPECTIEYCICIHATFKKHGVWCDACYQTIYWPQIVAMDLHFDQHYANMLWQTYYLWTKKSELLTSFFVKQVLWACFDRLELSLSSFKRVLLLGYSNGFQVLDVEDASNIRELVSKHDDPVSFLQMQPVPAESEGCEGFRASHPLLLVVACDKSKIPGTMQNVRDGHNEAQAENIISSATAVRFYSLRSHTYVHALRFRSTVYMVRCSPQIVAVGLATQVSLSQLLFICF